MKKTSIFLLLFLFTAVQSFSQNEESFFKVLFKPSDEFPNWANEMYKPDPNVFEVVKLYDKYYQENEFEKTIHTQNYKYWLNLVEPYVTKNGFIRVAPDPRILRNQENRKLGISPTQFRNAAPNWVQHGPFATYAKSGNGDQVVAQANVYSIAVAPSNHSILFATTETGGVFKSVDKGLNWTLTSLNETFTYGADVVIDPINPNIVYVANSKDVYKSTDQGATWSLFKQFPGFVQQIMISSSVPYRIFAATDSGLYRTTDGGQTWTVLFPEKTWDIVEHPTNPNIIYASYSNTAAKRAEVRKSTNAGDTWGLRANGWYTPAVLSEARDLGCKLAVTPAAPSRLYAGLIGESKAGDNGWIGVYYSLDGADSWVNPDGIDGGPYDANNPFWAGYGSGYHQGWYNYDLEVSDINPDKIWVGTIWDLESANRGASFEYFRSTRSFNMHADVQDIEVVGNDVWIVSDGGINYSNNEMQSTEIRQRGITSSHFWGFDHGWNEDVWTGGRYHNGDGIYSAGFGPGNTIFLGGAESPTGYIDVMNNKKAYFNDIATSEIGNTINDPVAFTPRLSLYPNASYSRFASSEIQVDPRYGSHFYLGSQNQFFKSTDSGANFEAIFSFPTTYRVLEFEIARTNPDIIYLIAFDGSSKSHIYKSTSGGTNFSELAALPLTSTRYLDLSLNPSDGDNLWVYDYYSGKVFQTEDGGSTWLDMTTSSLTDVHPVDIVYQGGTDDVVYVASEQGIFYYDKSLNDWVDYSTGLPIVPKVHELFPFYKENKLRLATSRGVWETDMTVESDPVAQPITKTNEIFCKDEEVILDSYSITPQDGATWEWSISPQPYYMSSTNQRQIVVKLDQNGTYDVTLSVTRNGVTSTKTVEDMLTLSDECSFGQEPSLALECDNSGDYGYVEGSIATGNSFTFMAWVKPDGIQSDYAGIIMAPTLGLNFRVNNEIGYHWTGGSHYNWSSGLVAPPDKWSHIALVIQPDKTTIYLDGVPSVQTVSNPVREIKDLYIGSYMAWANRNFKGQLDEVQLWNRALNQYEIREIRHLTRVEGQHYNTGLLAYFQFNSSRNPGGINGMSSAQSMVFKGNAFKTPSSAPVAGGISQRITIASSGPYNLRPDIGVNLRFAGINPNGEIVVSRLNHLPNIIPNNIQTLNNYWIINNYGRNDTFEPMWGIDFDGGTLTDTPINLNELQLTKRVDNEHLDAWTTLCNPTNQTNSILSFNNCNITSFSQFYLEGSLILPLDLIRFEAKLDPENNVDLTWETANEEAHDYFVIEHSLDGRNWDELGTIEDAAGTNNEYSYQHVKPSKGYHYYRLKIVDDQGDFEYSDLRVVFIEIAPEIMIIQTGGKGFAVVNSTDQRARIKVYSSEGKLKLDSFVEGQTTKQIDMNALSSGIYYVGIQSENQILTKSIYLIE